VHQSQRQSNLFDDRRASERAWQDRYRGRGLAVLLVLNLCLIFVALPLAAKGPPIAAPINRAMVLAVVLLVVLLSGSWGAIAAVLIGMTAIVAGVFPRPEWPSIAVSVLRRGGDILVFSALTWVVALAVYAPGRITAHRLQGAAVLYLNLATIFASVFGLIWELNPASFAGLPAPPGGARELAAMMYFSLTRLTTTGYGDIAPVDPFAGSLANLESVLGQFFLAITVARLVTQELEDRRR
jgi:hypothetical protein